jgi:UDP-N-acetylglucosamine--N-acetylmuramyl-(pentapeptide) pyrophosphoryl-undecaprenol N-acetylglucosamine transferase
MGGSQGASGINQSVIKALPLLHDRPIQLIHQDGTRDERLVADNYQREKIPAYVGAFHHAMEEVYSAADFAITRSGAASLAELAAFSLPAILIPFPYAAEDHQTRNAEIFVRAGAALLLKESDLTAELLAQKIRELLDHPEERQRLSEVSARLAPKNAAALVVETMERYTQPNHDARL